MTVTAQFCKMPFRTKHFNEGQRVWLVFMSGDAAAEVIGRFRGSGCYVHAWVNWRHVDRPEPIFKPADVSEGFAARHNLCLQ